MRGGFFSTWATTLGIERLSFDTECVRSTVAYTTKGRLDFYQLVLLLPCVSAATARHFWGRFFYKGFSRKQLHLIERSF